MLAIFGAMLVTKDGASNESAVTHLKNEALDDGTYADGRDSDSTDLDIF
jgi:hypothetical protein